MIKVLDKGYVKAIRFMGDDISIVEDARMSTDNVSGVDVKKDDSLRNYLWKNEHTSPSEGCVLTIEMKIPIFVLRQLDRHRTLDITNTEIEDYDDFRKYTSRNEFSGRYAEFPDEFYIPIPTRIQAQDKLNKQGSSTSLDFNVSSTMVKMLEDHYTESYRKYQIALSNGVSKEIARLFIPNSVYTKIRITANLLNWFKMLKLRLDPHAQYEVRIYAEAVSSIIKDLWPKAWEVFEENTLKGAHLSQSELNVISKVVNEYNDITKYFSAQPLLSPFKTFKDMLGKASTSLFNKLGIVNTNE